MPEKRTYIEKDRLVNESACKWMKRIIVGFIRYYEDQNSEANIPEIHFDDVPDNIGFDYEFAESEDGEDLRCFYLTEKWSSGVEDCGGEEFPADEMLYSVTDDVLTTDVATGKKHLKLIINNEPSKQ